MKKKILIPTLMAFLSVGLLAGCKSNPKSTTSEPDPSSSVDPTKEEPVHEVTYEEFNHAALEAERVNPNYTLAEFVVDRTYSNRVESTSYFSYYQRNNEWYLYEGVDDTNSGYLLDFRASHIPNPADSDRGSQFTYEYHWYLSSTTFEVRASQTYADNTKINATIRFNQYSYVTYEYEGYENAPVTEETAFVSGTINISYSTKAIPIPATPTPEEGELTYDEFHEIALKYHYDYKMPYNFAVSAGYAHSDSDKNNIDLSLYRDSEGDWHVYENHGDEVGAAIALSYIAFEAYLVTNPEGEIDEFHARIDKTGILTVEARQGTENYLYIEFNQYGLIRYMHIESNGIEIRIEYNYSTEVLPEPTPAETPIPVPTLDPTETPIPEPTPTPTVEDGEITYSQFHEIAIKLAEDRPTFNLVEVYYYNAVDGDVESGVVTYLIKDGSPEYYSGEQPQSKNDLSRYLYTGYAETAPNESSFRYYYIDGQLRMKQVDGSGNTAVSYKFDGYGRMCYAEFKLEENSIYLEYYINYYSQEI